MGNKISPKIITAVSNYDSAYSACKLSGIYDPACNYVSTIPHGCISAIKSSSHSIYSSSVTTSSIDRLTLSQGGSLVSCSTSSLDTINTNLQKDRTNNTNIFARLLQSWATLDNAYNLYGNSTSSADLSSTYNNINKTRSQLDQELNDLYNPETSVTSIFNKQLNTTMYATILWTVLATTLIYYVFIKL